MTDGCKALVWEKGGKPNIRKANRAQLPMQALTSAVERLSKIKAKGSAFDRWRSLVTVDRAIIGEVQVWKVSIVLMLRN